MASEQFIVKQQHSRTGSDVRGDDDEYDEELKASKQEKEAVGFETHSVDSEEEND